MTEHELNLWLAVHVLGWEIGKTPEGNYYHTGGKNPGRKFNLDLSTNISDAWLVVERLRELHPRDFSLSIEWQEETGDWDVVIAWSEVGDEDWHGARSSANSASLAICLAAKATIEAERERDAAQARLTEAREAMQTAWEHLDGHLDFTNDSSIYRKIKRAKVCLEKALAAGKGEQCPVCDTGAFNPDGSPVLSPCRCRPNAFLAAGKGE